MCNASGAALVEYVLTVTAVVAALAACRYVFPQAFEKVYKRIIFVVTLPGP